MLGCGGGGGHGGGVHPWGGGGLRATDYYRMHTSRLCATVMCNRTRKGNTLHRLTQGWAGHIGPHFSEHLTHNSHPHDILWQRRQRHSGQDTNPHMALPATPPGPTIFQNPGGRGGGYGMGSALRSRRRGATARSSRPPCLGPGVVQPRPRHPGCGFTWGLALRPCRAYPPEWCGAALRCCACAGEGDHLRWPPGGQPPLTLLVQHAGALAACFAGAPAQSSVAGAPHRGGWGRRGEGRIQEAGRAAPPPPPRHLYRTGPNGGGVWVLVTATQWAKLPLNESMTEPVNTEMVRGAP